MEGRVSNPSYLVTPSYLTLRLLISYRFNGKPFSATSKIPKFSRVAEKAGIFEITGVVHQQSSCQPTVSNMKMTIRDLPSARVSHGNNVYEDLREGPFILYC